MEALVTLAPAVEADRDALGRVLSVRLREARKELLTDLGSVVVVPRYAIAGRGTLLTADGRGVHIQTRNGRARLLPAYSRRIAVTLGGLRYRAEVKEPNEPHELDAYEHLSDLHYRGERGFGRKGVLIITTHALGLPSVLGYVEVTTGFLMNSPRTKLLDSPFRDGRVAWTQWGAREMSQLTSLIARVSRVVVHPELRGQGLGGVLLEHALKYARSHFHAGGLRPLFVEMTADMVRFVPFADGAGMKFIGNTEGNLHRVVKDMRYLLSRPDLLEGPTDSLKARGIMQAQRRYASGVAGVTTRRTIDDVATALKDGGPTMSAATYAELHGVLRLPKPTYLAGLTKPATDFLNRRLEVLDVVRPDRFAPSRLAPIDSAISVVRLSIRYRSTVARTERSTSVEEAFGIKPEAFESQVVSELSFRVEPGAVCLVFGPSGSGKTTLLNLLAEGHLGPQAEVNGQVNIPTNASIGRFTDLADDKPLIEIVAARESTAAAIHALNMAGLSDAKLYLRRFSELSNGQRYRAMLAYLMASDANVWVADEFLSTLDATTAGIVAANVAKHVRATGVTLVVGAPHFGAFLRSLQPDTVLQLISPWQSEVISGREFGHRWRATARVVNDG